MCADQLYGGGAAAVCDRRFKRRDKNIHYSHLSISSIKRISMYFNFTHYYDFTFERWILIEKEREKRKKNGNFFQGHTAQNNRKRWMSRKLRAVKWLMTNAATHAVNISWLLLLFIFVRINNRGCAEITAGMCVDLMSHIYTHPRKRWKHTNLGKWIIENVWQFDSANCSRNIIEINTGIENVFLFHY